MIELHHVQKVVGQNTVLDIETLAVARGEVAAVVCPAGSGKSALLALLTGQSRPTAGTVRLAGLKPTHARDRFSQKVGVLFAEDGLYERLSTRANLIFHCRLRNLPASRADELLAQVGLADHAAVQARRLPSGLARRLAFGRAILHHPAVLLLVEPFAGCDAASGTLLAGLIRQQGGEGSTVLILAAEAAGFSELCQTVHEMEQGRIVRTYAPQEDRQAEFPFKIPARLEGEVALVNPTDILYASAESGRACLHTAKGQIPTHFTLSELEERLARSGFFRAHRGYLVNLQRVKAVVPYTRDSFTLVLDDPASTEIPLSKTSARELRELLGY
jgi:ABC-2 type transport system ATP-binding protein